ncbi:Type II/IV secretion system ATP hydrolase TadA/VirB11/CpaF, TadA subfamily [Photobacterium marinum]|uniref:Type II/IV secretion system ATP hydrolase TadA/VirB11/CpaF, TadA subfamily n=1 Tax=Photobacterium marinum TaxID=1056511 RepID=L8JEP5_9GAMM|nr:CpaF family protein [Photobacterium marinum]ELR65892.1 Type II/IV secretion system ATP hydrolase TadA/VirB11/CpaF, TadA subfamily [Photobacterium marinum]
MFLKKNTSLTKTNTNTVENGHDQANFQNGHINAERQIKKQLLDSIFNSLDLSLLETLPEEQAREQISETAALLLLEKDVPLNAESRKRVIEEIGDEILGLGPLEPLLKDKSISDILVNAHNQIYVERKGKLEITDASFRDDSHLLNVIDRIVSQVGRRIDEGSPMVDARLKDGSRVNAIIPPLAIDGPSLSIRRFAVERLQMDQLLDYGTLNAEMAHFLEAIVQGRLNILISGGTGSGKTTTLNVCSGYIPKNERIITIEDSAELQLQQPHVVRLETRPPNIEGRGAITQRELVINSLRMRPDRIVVGEVRGAEAVDMLAAMNTGHDGSMTTIHANTPRDALGRIENMFAMAGWNMPIKNVRAQIASALNVVVQLRRMEDGKRRITSIVEINNMEGDVITMTELFKFQRTGIDEEGNVTGQYLSTGNVPSFMEAFKHLGIDLPYTYFTAPGGL